MENLNNQGLYGALLQYWDIQPKARLSRKNTYFEDNQVSNSQALRVGIVVTMIAVAIIGSWSLCGVIL